METGGHRFNSLFGPNISTTGVVVPNHRAWALTEAAKRYNDRGYSYRVLVGTHNPITGQPLAPEDTRITISTPDSQQNLSDLHRLADEIEMEMEAGSTGELPGVDCAFYPID